jgi:hypothetical protein
MSSNSKLELQPPIQNRNARNKAEQTRDDKKTRTKKKKNLLLLQIIGLQSVSAKTGTFFHTAAKENQRLHQMQQNSTRSKCPLRKRICIFTFDAEAQKSKPHNYSPLAPLPPEKKYISIYI